jgi:hypothetical protein
MSQSIKPSRTMNTMRDLQWVSIMGSTTYVARASRTPESGAYKSGYCVLRTRKLHTNSGSEVPVSGFASPGGTGAIDTHINTANRGRSEQGCTKGAHVTTEYKSLAKLGSRLVTSAAEFVGQGNQTASWPSEASNAGASWGNLKTDGLTIWPASGWLTTESYPIVSVPRFWPWRIAKRRGPNGRSFPGVEVKET